MNTNWKSVKLLVEEISEALSKAHVQIKKTVVPVTARDLAEKNLPTANDSSVEPYVGPFKSRYASLKKDVQLKIAGGIQKFLGMLSGSHLTQKIREVKEKIKAWGNKLTNLEIDLNRCILPWNYKVYKNVMFILILFGLSDSIWTTSSFLTLSDILIVALVVGAVVGLSQVFATKAAVLAIRQMQSARRRTKYYLLATAGALLVSVVLGLLRDNYIRQNTDGTISYWGSNFIVFAIINMVPIAATALLLNHYYPTIEQMEDIKRYEDIKEQIKYCNDEIRSLEREQEQLERERVEGLSLNEKLIHDETILLEKIDTLYDDSFAVFTHENIIRRSDGLYPACFKRAHESIPNPVIDHFNIPNKEAS